MLVLEPFCTDQTLPDEIRSHPTTRNGHFWRFGSLPEEQSDLYVIFEDTSDAVTTDAVKSLSNDDEHRWSRWVAGLLTLGTLVRLLDTK